MLETFRILCYDIYRQIMEGSLMKSLFCCPICREELYMEEKRLYCPLGHSFDRAKSGYVNLLRTAGKNHGDNKEMISARRAFLEGGHYSPLRDALCEVLQEDAPGTLFDAGCGEGWYTSGMSETLPDSKIGAVDISAVAAGYAGKRRLPNTEIAVASLYDLPVADASFDALTLLFSPFSRKEFLRILKPGGRMYMAVPGRRHLYGLKELLYENPYENILSDTAVEGFTFEKEEHILFEKRFEGEELRALFRMTPYFYRTPEAGRKRAETAEFLKTELEFYLFCYRRDR